MIQIGSLDVDLEGRQLLRNGVRLAVGARTFDILVVLVEAHGSFVSKHDLIRQVWPSTIVVENNLYVHLSKLRSLLGENRSLLQTVTGRGYRLTIPGAQHQYRLSRIAQAEETKASAKLPIPNNLPTLTSPIIGRDDAISELIDVLAVDQHVTLVGPGGIGKTRLAIEVAHRALSLFRDGVYLISLVSATDFQDVLHAATRALAVEASDGPLSLTRISEDFIGSQVLVLLDNCEHVAAAAAQLAEALAGASKLTRVIATSREPIHLTKERIYRVEPLSVAEQTNFKDDALRCSAVELFFSHATALDPLFPSDERSHELIHSICRRLDGIPLAIELAAARASVLGVETLATRLDSRFSVLTGGSRSALPRHQTLKATFDWSYALLNEPERATLRRISVFPAAFTMPAAVAVASDSLLGEFAIVDAVAGLIDKSLVARTTCAGTSAYELLQTTRAYAQERLDDNGERQQASRRHAAFFCETLGPMSDTNSFRAYSAWQHAMRAVLGDLRAALTWALSSQGDKAIAEVLAVRFVWLLFELSLFDECVKCSQRSLDALVSALPKNTDSLKHARMHLQTAMAAARAYLQAPGKTTALWAELLTSAIASGDKTLEACALWGLWNVCQSAGDANSALSFANRFSLLEADVHQDQSSDDVSGPDFSMLGYRLVGMASHLAGDQRQANSSLQRLIFEPHAAGSWIPPGRTIGHNVVNGAVFARVLWLRGERERALMFVNRWLDEARVKEQAIATCYTLIEAAIPIALLSNDRKAATEAIGLLCDASNRIGLKTACAFSRTYDSYLVARDRPTTDHLSELSAAIDELDAGGLGAHAPMLLAQYAILQGRCGQRGEAIATVGRALRRCDQTGNRWYVSELHRVRGALLADMAGTPAVSAMLEAEQCFFEAIEVAERQGAASLQLRAALSLARLWHTQGRFADALDRLKQACALFPDDCAWPEAQEASRLDQDLSEAMQSRPETTKLNRQQDLVPAVHRMEVALMLPVRNTPVPAIIGTSHELATAPAQKPAL
ncbi:winged helix-turn-helix domain-containing protein [Paraburkholderia strydomiana]|uniref:winged helix-turn-helix domain-containing protein n=1 Tax=Paraburkholderia strydomiana TaxID=1245417 RepID=UPI00285A807B|nr:winged helix-turn-helix domain-containing protein [Paraburkholderia strydomiana]MDR7008876.1 putative ATPase/DNA-binding winged helix-turn-helix (wHTH) protein [Paraburkholderia strydomiana]